MSKDFISAAIGKKKKKIEGLETESAASPLKVTIDEVDEDELEGAKKVPMSKVPSTNKPKAEDVMSIDLMLGSAKKKKPVGEVDAGPTEIGGKEYTDQRSEKYLRAIKKLKKG